MTRLTVRQLQVMRLVAAGMTDYDIGRELGVSERTVGAHTQAIYEALDVPGRIAAINRCYRLGLIPPPLHPVPPRRRRQRVASGQLELA